MNPADRPYFSVEECKDLAFCALKASGAQIRDDDVDSLAEGLKRAVDDWFGDMKHLKPKHRPVWS
jgi:hypothetical protein